MEMEHGRNQHLRTLAHTLDIANRQACHFTYTHRDMTPGKGFAKRDGSKLLIGKRGFGRSRIS